MIAWAIPGWLAAGVPEPPLPGAPLGPPCPIATWVPIRVAAEPTFITAMLGPPGAGEPTTEVIRTAFLDQPVGSYPP